ncbi:hypothetical protein [Virgisporangium aurantiacum]|uniref:Uncharacterized protein n=1 Tax=Virgisporangium aurantiacum TaxID=175570 RepID=A0A8J3ZJD4_9ACTN|nr:hypothetical protein [Virgisporangium aurantiacum]GIJ64027.1 hypothetical protein Vau01_115430 [Virgisporangium aurantiacum]
MNWKVGDTLRVRLDDGPRDLRIVALLPDTFAGPLILLSLVLAPVDGDRRYIVRLAAGADVPTVSAASPAELSPPTRGSAGPPTNNNGATST